MHAPFWGRLVSSLCLPLQAARRVRTDTKHGAKAREQGGSEAKEDAVLKMEMKSMVAKLKSRQQSKEGRAGNKTKRQESGENTNRKKKRSKA